MSKVSFPLRKTWTVGLTLAVAFSILTPTTSWAQTTPTPTPAVAPTLTPTVAPSSPGLPDASGSQDDPQPLVSLEDRVTALIVFYEVGVSRFDAMGEPTGSNVIPEVNVSRSTLIGAGMSTLELAAPVDVATAEALAAELTADPRIRWASPDGWKRPVLDTALTVSMPIDLTVSGPDGSATKSGAFTYVDLPPTISGLDVVSGPVAGGAIIVISGTNLADATMVTFGGTAASIQSTTSSTVTVATPSKTASVVSVSVTTAGGTATATNSYTFVNPPSLTTISPTTGLTNGGMTVTLSGSNLSTASAVTFGGAAATIQSTSAGSVTVTAPATQAGSVSVDVVTAGGSATLTNAFTFVDGPTFSGLSVVSGPLAGGTTVVILGTNLSTVSSVTFGGTSATIQSTTSSSVTVKTPAKPAGTVSVVVTAAGGVVTARNAFTFVAVPTLSSLTPVLGSLVGGQTVVLTGTNLSTTASVTFGGTAAVIQSATATTVTVTTPAKTAGAFLVVVKTAGGSVTKTSAFTYQAAPTIASVSSAMAGVSGGVTVTLNGTNLANITDVLFGDTTAIISSKTTTTVVVTSPAHSAGIVTISASGLNGTASMTNSYTYVAGPTVTRLSVVKGPLAGGTVVVLTGTNLSLTSLVTFGGTAATIQSSSDSSLTVKTPAKTAGLVSVVVTTSGGSVTKTSAFTYVALPTLTSISPALGRLTGGQTATLTGTNLSTASTVTFGGTTATIVAVTATTVTVTTPAKAAGAVSVSVTTAGGTATKATAFTYRMSDITKPNSIPSRMAVQVPSGTGARVPFARGGTFQVNTPAKADSSSNQLEAAAGHNSVLAYCGLDSSTYVIQRCYDDSDYDAGYYALNSEIIYSDVFVTAARKSTLVIETVPYRAITDNYWLYYSDTFNNVYFDSNGDGYSDVAISDQNQYLAAGQTGYGWVYDWSISSQTWVKRSSTCSTTISRVASGSASWWQFQTDWTCLFGSGAGASNVRAISYLEDVNGYDLSPNSFSASDSMNLSALLAPAPTISSVSPNTGPNSGGTSVTISGTNLSTTSQVTIGGIAAQITSLTSTSVTVTTVRSSSVGLVAVGVTTTGGTATASNSFTYSSSAPTITGVSPNTGVRAGGSSVTITGTNLTSITSVAFGGSTAANITAQTATSITVTVPAEAPPYSAQTPTEINYSNGTLWGLTGTYGVDAPAAWTKTQGSSNVIVAVLDTGITTHSDLGPQVSGYDMISLDDTNNDGIGDQAYVANDGDGRDPSPADPGDWISVSENNGGSASGYLYGCTVGTSSWHGTHVAGTINAAINGSGSVGIAPNVLVQPVRVLGKCGGRDSDIVAGILWAAGSPVSGIPNNTTPADVISLSLGGSGACSVAMQSAIDYAWSHGVVITIAAGNSNADASTFSPASCNHVVTVAATDSAGKRASFSNYGSAVEISAPGVGIYSTMNSGTTSPSSETYVSWNGTSMATPHVAAVVALILSREPSLTPSDVLTRLQTTATGFAGGSCDFSSAKTCGTGIANAGAAVH